MAIKEKLNILKSYLTKSKILLSNNKINFLKSNKIKDQGFLYIAFKKNFLDEAILSASSLKKNTKKKIAIFTNINDHRLNNIFDFIGIINPSNIRSKVDFISKYSLGLSNAKNCFFVTCVTNCFFFDKLCKKFIQVLFFLMSTITFCLKIK